MRNVFGVVLILIAGLCVFFCSNQCNAYMKGDVNDDGKIDLIETISSLQVVTGQKSVFSTKTINVPGDFSSIQQAVDAANGGDTINVKEGTFNELLVINKDNLTLQGAGKDITIINGDGANPTIHVQNARNISINGFSIKNGSYGILLNYSSIASFNNRFENNYYGIRATNNSHANIYENTIKSNLNTGIRISNNSSADISGNEISENSSTGVRISESSSSSIESNTITNNGGNGIQASQGASISLVDNVISNNTYSGIDVTGHSVAGLWGGNKIYQNADNSGWRAGIGVYHSSEVTIGFSATSDEISNNKGPGLFIANSSSLFVQSGNVVNNQGDGVHLRFDSVAQLEGASIKTNSGFGVGCGDQFGDSKYMDNGVTDFGSVGPPDTRNNSGTTNCSSL